MPLLLTRKTNCVSSRTFFSRVRVSPTEKIIPLSVCLGVGLVDVHSPDIPRDTDYNNCGGGVGVV